MAEEGYRLTVTSKGVVIKANRQGCFLWYAEFHAAVACAGRECNQGENGVKWVAQCCDIQDAPRFGYRGFHLDPCRHFITVENVRSSST